MPQLKKGVQSLSVRVALLLSVALFALMLIASLWVDNRLTKAIEQQEIGQFELQSKSLLASLGTLMVTGNGPLVREWLSNLVGANAIIEANIYDAKGQLAFQNNNTIQRINQFLGEDYFPIQDYPDKLPESVVNLDMIDQALTDRMMTYYLEEERLLVALPIFSEPVCSGCHGYDNHPLRGIFSLVVDRHDFRQQLSEMRTTLWFISGLLTILLGAGIFILLRINILKPLADLSHGIVRVASGDRQTKLPVVRNDELGAVARLFNVMQEHIEESEARIRAVMDNVMDVVLILSRDGRIEAANPMVFKLFGYQPADLLGEQVGKLLVKENHHDKSKVRFLSEDYFQLTKIMQGPVREDIGLRKDHTVFPVDVTVNRMLVGDMLHYVVTFRDVSARVEQMQSLKQLALHDPLTSLPNRILLADRLQHAVSAYERNRQGFALLFMDLDRFKEINDSLGHYVGDELLRVIADRLTSVVRKVDTVARLGGDEFAILLPNMGQNGTEVAVNKVLSSVVQELSIEGHKIKPAASIGIAVFPDHGEDQVTIMQHADIAMYAAKRSGGGYRFYSAETEPSSPGKSELALTFMRKSCLKNIVF